MMSFLRSAYARVAPRAVRKIVHPVLHPAKAIVASHSRRRAGGVVASGPCRGLRFGRVLDDVDLEVAKQLGTYEMELHPVLESMHRHGFTHIVDVGAAEGYYAVGLLVSRPERTVTAFEMNESHRRRLAALARENGVTDRLALHGYCDHAGLNALGDRLATSFLIMDVEGFEKELLDPAVVPALRRATMLVEVHDCFVPGCTQAIRERFASTHVITEIPSVERNVTAFPFEGWVKQNGLLRGAIADLMADGRTVANGWLFLEPRHGASE